MVDQYLSFQQKTYQYMVKLGCLPTNLQYHGYMLLWACGAVAHLLAVLNSACLCFVGPKSKGQILDPKDGTPPKIKSPASKFVPPSLGPWYMRFAFCKERVELWQVANLIHVFMRLVPRCWFHSRLRSEGRQKACRPIAPKMGPRPSASHRSMSKGAGMPMLFCSKYVRWNFDCHKQRKEMWTSSGTKLPAPLEIKVDLVPHSAKQLHRERKQDWLLWVATLIPGKWGHACVYISTYINVYWLGRKTTKITF